VVSQREDASEALSPLDVARSQDATFAAHAASYPLFDWLRFGLAAVVVAFHTNLVTWRWAGQLAVSVFFALSGWLIGGILLGMKRSDLPRFFYNRATRIWVPYAVSLAFLYSFALVYDRASPRGLWPELFLHDITFTRNWFPHIPSLAWGIAHAPLSGSGGVVWSLAFEEQFYLLAPLIILFLGFGRSPAFWALIFSGLFFVESSFAAIAAGVFAAALHRRYPGWHLRSGAVVALLVVLTASAYAVNRDLFFFSPFFSVALVLLAARPGSRSEVASFWGGVSYPLYLNHWFGRYVGHSLVKHLHCDTPFANGIANFFVGILVGVGFFRFVDRRVLAVRNGFFTEGRGKRLGLAAYALVAAGFVLGFGIMLHEGQHPHFALTIDQARSAHP
jgi:peptidoglycan/LPS O-acetylase OafA/YrhL